MRNLFLAGAVSLCSLTAFGQAGLIYKPAGNALGKSVLDPNADGYVSSTSAGYSSTNDGPSFSEHAWIPLPTMENEPHSDLVTGANGGHTDIVNNGTGQSVYVLVKTIGGIDYLMVRFRIGKASTASKGYSLLIDTDTAFGTVVGSNPGFEKEVVLETGTRVGVYTHTGGTSTRDQSYDINNYHHRAIAASNTNGDADYFYDYFVPLSALNTTSAVRIVATTITSAQSGISGTVSDFNGIDDKKYGNDRLTLFKAMINSFPTGITFNDLKTPGFTFPPMKFPPPTVNTGLTTSSASISGTSTEPNGTVIQIYKNGSALGKATVSSNAYTLSAVSGLTQGDKINARTMFNYENTGTSTSGTTLTVTDTTGLRVDMPLTFVSGTGAFATNTTVASITNNTTVVLSATPTTPLAAATITGTNKTASDTSNTVVVFAAAQCYTAPPTLLASPNERSSSGSSYYLNGTYANADGSPITAGSVEIKVWNQTGTNTFTQVNSGTTYTVPINGSWSFLTGLTANNFNGANLLATATKGNCTSTYSRVSTKTNGNTAIVTDTPTIVTRPILEKATTPAPSITLKNNGANAADLYLYKNGTLVGNAANVSGGSPGTVTFNNPYPGLADGDILTARAQSLTIDYVLSNNSSPVTVTASTVQTNAPLITGTYLNGGTSVTGTCSEIGGTEIKVYKNGTILGTTTLTAFGTWTLTGITLATNDILTAYATAPGKTLSPISNSVTVRASAPAAPTVTNSYVAGGDSITGTSANSAVVIVYIDGSPVDTVTANGSGNWLSTGYKVKKELYKGAVIHATVLVTGIESASSNTKTVGGVASYSLEIRQGGTILNEPNINLVSGVDFQIEVRALNTPAYTSANTASSSGTTITVTSTTNLDTGMVVKVTAGTGSFLPGTKVLSITDLTTFVVSKTPTTALSGATVTGAAVLTNYTSPVNLSSTKPILLFTGNGQAFTSGHLGYNGSPNNDTVTVTLGGNGSNIPLRVTNPDDPSAFGETNVALLSPCYWKGRNTGTVSVDKGHNQGDNWTNAISGGGAFGKVPRKGADVKFANDAIEDMLLEDNYSWGTLDFNNTGTSNSKHVILGNNNLTLKAIADRDTNVIKTTGTGKLIMKVERGGSVTFPVGNKRYNPLAITNNGVEADTFKVLVRDEMYANGSSGTLSDLKRVQKTWDISRVNSNSGTGVDLSFTWLSDGSSNGEESQIIAANDLALYHHNGSVWIEELACGTATVNNGLRTVAATGYLGTFSPFGIGDENQPLPIELLDFSANCQAGFPSFAWTTATETNNKHFNLEQSPDLEIWTSVAQVNGAGFSSSPKSYSFDLTNFSPSKGLYFRLKQTDYDAKFESFEPIYLGACLGLVQTEVNLWPNPTDQTLEITGFDAESTASVVNALGQQVATIAINNGEATLFDAAALPSGMYNLLGQKNGLPFQLKWVKK